MVNDPVICIDFGASRIKALAYDLADDLILQTQECPSPSTKHKIEGDGTHEIPAEEYWQCLERCTAPLLQAYPCISELYICSEMHGFVLWDKDSNLSLTGYISWQDQRVTQKSDLYKILQQSADVFFTKTGMKLKPGLPAVIAAHLSKKEEFKYKNFILCTLVDWLLLRGGCIKPCSNVTLAAGTGFYNITENTWDRDLTRNFIPNINIAFCEITDKALLGTITLNNKKIDVYGGFGDFQTALRGMDFGIKAKAAINLGTGSQVAFFKNGFNEAYELRPWNTKSIFRTITHIPSGRAINVFKTIIDNIFTLKSGGDGIFWDIWASLTVNDVINAPLHVDLNIFNAAWKYSNISGFIQLKENVTDIKSIIASIALNWLKQYKEALNIISDNSVPEKIIVGGGCVHRADFIVPVLDILCDREIITTKTTVDETLLGLIKFAKQRRLSGENYEQ